MQKLNAEENLDRALTIAIGSGTLPVEEQRRIIRDWRAQAWPAMKKKKLSKEQQQIMLATMGIGIEVIKK